MRIGTRGRAPSGNAFVGLAEPSAWRSAAIDAVSGPQALRLNH